MYKSIIEEGKAILGIEFGSTRIKAVLIDDKGNPIASGSKEWENELRDGIWTYGEDTIWSSLRECYSDLKDDVKAKYQTTITSLAGIGFSAMMHGYLPFDKDDNLLVPFRTWRNTITGEASSKLTSLFGFNIPQRWSIAHLYQAILNNEEHVSDICHINTLAGYVHFKLTGNKVLGIGDASGMFPIDSKINGYDDKMLDMFDELIKDRYDWRIRDILPKVMVAGECAGELTLEGALLLDPEGDLKPGILMCPPEGDAGTGMVATNSVEVGTGNISAGTSVFAMIVLDEALKKLHEEIDMVTTPVGAPVAMVHANNCSSEINAWVNLFDEVGALMGSSFDRNELFTKLYSIALEGESDAGGLLYYNYLSGEPVVGLEKGVPLWVRGADSRFTLPNFMRMHLMSAMGTLKVGLDILKEEGMSIDRICGAGGFFKTPKAGQTICSACVGAPVTVLETAGEGGAWGVAILALYATLSNKESLASFLNDTVFKNASSVEIMASSEETSGFDKFMEMYKSGLEIERKAIEKIY